MEEEAKRSWLKEEIEGVSLPDKRFRANIISIAEHLNEHADFSFSAACGERLRKCAWRLFSAEELNLLNIHQQRTLSRCAGEGTILIAEDTTDIHYRQPGKQGMGATHLEEGIKQVSDLHVLQGVSPAHLKIRIK